MLFFFIGITGVGKSTAGKRVAREMGYSFIDLDALVEVRNSMRLREIFNHGEDCFRLSETKALLSIDRASNHIVATGGGIVERVENIDIMKKNGIIVLLKRPIKEIFSGMSFAHRPLLRKNPDKLWEIYERRKPLYASAADLTYNLEGIPFNVDAIVEELKLYATGKKHIIRVNI